MDTLPTTFYYVLPFFFLSSALANINDLWAQQTLFFLMRHRKNRNKKSPASANDAARFHIKNILRSECWLCSPVCCMTPKEEYNGDWHTLYLWQNDTLNCFFYQKEKNMISTSKESVRHVVYSSLIGLNRKNCIYLQNSNCYSSFIIKQHNKTVIYQYITVILSVI